MNSDYTVLFAKERSPTGGQSAGGLVKTVRISRHKNCMESFTGLKSSCPTRQIFPILPACLPIFSCMSTGQLLPLPPIIIHLLSQEPGLLCWLCRLKPYTEGPTRVAPCQGGRWRLKSRPCFSHQTLC